MKLIYYLKNLFTGYRPYRFTHQCPREKPQQQDNLSQQEKSSRQKRQKRFMSKHRYTHTTHNWNIGNTHKK
ncbi:MAG: hypothetical protein AAB453_04395 [Patescibacteria group bacterium]